MDPQTRKITISRDVKFLEIMNEPGKVIANLDNKKTDDLEVDQAELKEDSVIVIEDSILNDTSQDTTYEDPDDSVYEPSEETLLDAEEDELNDVSPSKQKKKAGN